MVRGLHTIRAHFNRMRRRVDRILDHAASELRGGNILPIPAMLDAAAKQVEYVRDEASAAVDEQEARR